MQVYCVHAIHTTARQAIVSCVCEAILDTNATKSVLVIAHRFYMQHVRTQTV